ncbi:MAG: ABC transporter ATP-binding protein [Phaeodactylibacter sp.]|nr:ABC transporter ATP-binding protein [Phaeodactylibacter sp.]MCB9293783.1 ABC transporter ATP-binding protein [Lewinellaceae bacterium]
MRVLNISGLSKRYGKITAVDNLSLEVGQGMSFGILGPNGSGKTTTLGIILGIIHQNSGSFTWFGGRYGKWHRHHIGALLETPNFYPYLNAVDNLRLIAHIRRVQEPRIDHLLELVNLHRRRHSRFRTFSLGMKQRLAIAGAMIGDPEVLIFDEPTNGLDPQGIAEVRQTLREIAAMGKTIIMASHILDEVEKVCSHVAIIKEGRLLASGTVGAIISDDMLVEVSAENLDGLKSAMGQYPPVRRIEEEEGKLILYLSEEVPPAQINQVAFRQGVALSHLRVVKKSLESEFLEITGKKDAN